MICLKDDHHYYHYLIFQNGILVKAIYIYSMFDGCSSLLSLLDISKWNTNYVINMLHIFDGCLNLIISKATRIKFYYDLNNK